VIAREGRGLVRAGKHGRSRRIPIAALEHIAVALVLNRDLGVAIAKAVGLAGQICRAPGTPISIGSLGVLTFDLVRLRSTLELAISEALESVAEPVRGRPRSTTSARRPA